jgi:hypothetical protein
MREQLVRHFDVVVVIWALSLCLAFMLVGLSRAQLGNEQWTSGHQTSADWTVPSTGM